MLPATSYVQPATCNLQPTTCNLLLPVTYNPLPATCYLQLAIFNMQVSTCNLLYATCYMLPATCSLLPATCNLQPAICNLLPTTCYLLINFLWSLLLLDFGLLNVLEQSHICVLMKEIIFKLSLACTIKRCEIIEIIGCIGTTSHLCVNGIIGCIGTTSHLCVNGITPHFLNIFYLVTTKYWLYFILLLCLFFKVISKIFWSFIISMFMKIFFIYDFPRRCGFGWENGENKMRDE